jgi:NADH-quinone oxidoreductase subunit J
MTLCLVITAIVTLLAAVCAMSLRNLVHCALTLAVSFSGIAAIYLQLDAEFVGFTEILVYVGAVAILVVMAILLTRSGETTQPSVLTSGRLDLIGKFAGIGVTAAIFTTLGWAILSSSVLAKPGAVAPQVTVKDIGEVLMTRYVLPLEIVGLVLTAAMIGAVIIAYKEEAKSRSQVLPGAQTKTATSNQPAVVPPAENILKKAGVA